MRIGALYGPSSQNGKNTVNHPSYVAGTGPPPQPPVPALAGEYCCTIFSQNLRFILPSDAFTNSSSTGSNSSLHHSRSRSSNLDIRERISFQSSGVPRRVAELSFVGLRHELGADEGRDDEAERQKAEAEDDGDELLAQEHVVV